MSTPKSLEMRQNEIIADFQSVKDWEERYKKIIALGKSLPDMEASLKTEESRIKGCQSQVWLHAYYENGRIRYVGDSDALIVRGLVALSIQIYSGSTPREVIETPPQFLQSLGLSQNLSPSRANGLFQMIKQIRNFAIVFSSLENKPL